MNREPSWLIFDIILPLLTIAAYVYVYKAMSSPEQFIGYVILGGAMTGIWLFILWNMASQFYWEKETGNLEIYMMAPISRMAILIGMAAGGIFSTAIRSISTLILGAFVFSVAFSVAYPIQLIIVFVLTMIALFGMGMLFSSLFMVFGREAWHTSNLLQEPIYLLSGFYFPVKGMGIYVATAASLIPITLGLDGMRQLLFKGGGEWALLSVNTEILILIFLSIGFIIASHFGLIYMENLGKREGRLTLKWQ